MAMSFQLTLHLGAVQYRISVRIADVRVARAPALSDLALGQQGLSVLLAEIDRRARPRVRCVRGHPCYEFELNEQGLCPNCLASLGLS